MKKLIIILLALVSMTITVATNANALAQKVSGVANVNTATVEELQLIPGIGLSKAMAIVAERKTKPFENAQDLLDVKGIGDKVLSQMTPYVTVTGETTLHVVDDKNSTQ